MSQFGVVDPLRGRMQNPMLGNLAQQALAQAGRSQTAGGQALRQGMTRMTQQRMQGAELAAKLKEAARERQARQAQYYAGMITDLMAGAQERRSQEKMATERTHAIIKAAKIRAETKRPTKPSDELAETLRLHSLEAVTGGKISPEIEALAESMGLKDPRTAAAQSLDLITSGQTEDEVTQSKILDAKFTDMVTTLFWKAKQEEALPEERRQAKDKLEAVLRGAYSEGRLEQMSAEKQKEARDLLKKMGITEEDLRKPAAAAKGRGFMDWFTGRPASQTEDPIARWLDETLFSKSALRPVSEHLFPSKGPDTTWRAPQSDQESRELRRLLYGEGQGLPGSMPAMQPPGMPSDLPSFLRPGPTTQPMPTTQPVGSPFDQLLYRHSRTRR